MAANDAAALVVALSAQLTKFEKDMDNAYGIADRGVRKIEDRFSKANYGGEGITDFAKKLLTAGGVVEAISKIQELVAEAAKIGDVAERVGLTTDQFQQLRFAAVSVGTAAETADGFMDRFSRSISEAGRGAGELYKTFQLNNVAIKDSSGNLLPTNVLLGKFADLVKNAKNAQDQMNLAVLAGGRQAGPELVGALKQGSDGLQRFGDDAIRAGVIIDSSVIEKAKQVQSQFNTLKLQAQTKLEQLAVAAAPTIQKIGDDTAHEIDLLKKGWQIFLDFIRDTPVIAPSFKAIDDQIEKEKQSYNGILNSQLRAAGIEALKGGKGTPLTGAEGFPGYTAPKQQATQLVDVQAEAFKKLIESQENSIRLTQAEQQGIGQTAGQVAQLKTQIELENRAKQENIPLTAQRIAAIQAEAQKTGDAAQALDDYKRKWTGLNDAVQFAGNQVIDVIDGLRTKSLTASQAIVQLGNAFIHAAEQALLLGGGPLAGLFGTASATAGGTGGLLGAIFGVSGARAGGGSVAGGQSYLVGENGPEIFTPNAGGVITPNSAVARGAGGVAINIVSKNVFQAGVTPTDMAAISAMVDQKDAKLQATIYSGIRQGNRNDSRAFTG